MTQPIFNQVKIKILEGRILNFKVLNTVELQDRRAYFILEDPNGVKHFIDAATYRNHGLIKGATIQCKVTKINCTGRIILEPLHPQYVEGETYLFKILSTSDLSNSIELLIEDVFQNRIELSSSKSLMYSAITENRIRCKVLDFKKGIPEVEIVP